MLQHLSLPRQILPLHLWKLQVTPAGVDGFSSIFIWLSVHAYHVPLGRWHRHHWIPLHPCRTACQHCHGLSKHVAATPPLTNQWHATTRLLYFYPSFSTSMHLMFLHVMQTKHAKKSWLHAIMSEHTGSLHRSSSGDDLPESLIVAATLDSNTCSSMYVDLYINIICHYWYRATRCVHIRAHIWILFYMYMFKQFPLLVQLKLSHTSMKPKGRAWVRILTCHRLLIVTWPVKKVTFRLLVNGWAHGTYNFDADYWTFQLIKCLVITLPNTSHISAQYCSIQHFCLIMEVNSFSPYFVKWWTVDRPGLAIWSCISSSWV